MLRHFTKNESGNIAMIFGLSSFAILGATSAGLDYSRMTNTRAALIAAADAAALAAAQAALARDLSAFEVERGKRKHGAMVTRDQVLLALKGFLLYDAEGRLVIKDRVHNDKERYEVAAGLSGLAANTVKKYVAGFREYGRIVPGLPVYRVLANLDARR